MNKLLLLMFLFLGTTMYSQTPSSLDETMTIVEEDGKQRSISLGNAALNAGAKLAYVINKNADFSENILFNIRFRKDLYSGVGFALPLVSNISLGNWGDVSDETVTLTDGGVSLGLYPYFLIPRGNLTIVPHFEVSAKLFPGESLEDSKKRYKAAANIELWLAKEDGQKNTISVGAFYSSNENIEMRNMYGLDVTALLPLDLNSAFLIDYKKPFSGSGLLSLGIVVK